MNTLLEKLGSNATTNAIIITDVRTLKEAFSLWAAEEAAKRENERRNTIISAKEAANRLSVTMSTLWRWEKTKYLVPIKIGRRNSYRLADILDIIERRCPSRNTQFSFPHLNLGHHENCRHIYRPDSVLYRLMAPSECPEGATSACRSRMMNGQG